MRFPPNQLLLYKLFLSYPDRSFYMQEIGRILGKKPGVFQRTLYNLESDGFVQSTYKANARFFLLNKNYTVLKEIHSIIRKTSNEMNVFKDIIKDMDYKRKKSKRKRDPLKPQKQFLSVVTTGEDQHATFPGKKIASKSRSKKPSSQMNKDSQLELF